MTRTRWALASLSLSMLMSSLDTSIANAALPTLARAFNAPFGAVQWIVLAYLIAVTSLIVTVGRIGDIIGRRRLLLVGIALFTVASLACGIAPTLPALIAARAAQGLGAAIMMALTLTFVRDAAPQQKTGSAMGLLGTMSAVGTTLGPSLGGILIATVGWRAIFLVNVPLGVLNIVLAHRYLPGDSDVKTSRTETTLLGLTLKPFALAFRDHAIGGSLAVSAVVSMVMMATLVVGPFYLSREFGLSTALVGLVLSVGPLVAALTGVPAGRLVDRLGGQRMVAAGLLGIASGSALLAIMPVRFGVAGYISSIVVMTASYALFQAANNTVIMVQAGAEQRGAVSGMLSLSRNLGLIAGTSAMGALYVAAGMRVTFATAAALMIIAAYLSRSKASTSARIALSEKMPNTRLRTCPVRSNSSEIGSPFTPPNESTNSGVPTTMG